MLILVKEYPQVAYFTEEDDEIKWRLDKPLLKINGGKAKLDLTSFVK